MRVSSKIVIDIDSGAIMERECYEYFGPVAACITGSGGKTKSKSKQQSTSESGTKYNEDFLRRASEWASGITGTGGANDTSSTNFDAAAYLKANPDVATSPDYGSDPYRHWLEHGQSEGRNFTPYSTVGTSANQPTYNPQYVKGNFYSVAPGGFDKLESELYGSAASKLKQAYDTGVGQQREELAQMGALNSPSQYLEGSARSSLDRTYMQQLQQAARDAFLGRLGAEQTDAQNRTAFDVGEATRQTGFNQDTMKTLLQYWLQKLAYAIEAGRYSSGQSTGESSGSGLTGSGGLFNFGGSQSTSANSGRG